MCVIQFSGSIILLDDLMEFIKPHINDETGKAIFHKWFDMLLPVDIAFVEGNLTGVIRFFNESTPIARELALHVDNKEISELLLRTSNECEILIGKSNCKHANIEEIYFFLFRSVSNFNILSQV